MAEELGSWTELVFDRSEPPARPLLRARQETSTSTAAASGSSNASASTSSTGGETLSTATPTSQSPIPSPFDSFMSNNFTVPSCPTFIQNFLSNDTFQKCTPLSLLLQTSNGFFAAERSAVRLTQTLDAACNADFALCSSVMASLAQDIQLSSNCGADLALQNPVVQQAYHGFVGYDPLWQAGCLKNSAGSYCFANAVTNASAPTSSYIYYLPLGVQLPAGTRPACNQCLQDTMTIFAQTATNNSVPLSGDYTAAAALVDASCGPTFVVQQSVMATNAASSIAAVPFGMGIIPLIVVLGTLFL
ncbi:hypothetical protein LTR36_001264 [Oleoguttula mirabilis]|uniref:DUF7729 domain-containing protein n=1 Tax=Oleoguttula mirabilis TaxID=1507867 RepID=A0AAV9JNT1_9PEZI|nr:hypothetical protein LTR36_001264 [Oleoguttula mirabilis]